MSDHFFCILPAPRISHSVVHIPRKTWPSFSPIDRMAEVLLYLLYSVITWKTLA
jgi:hypothetical protein